MADLYGPATTSASPPEPEEISAFFNQLLHGSSSASSSSCLRIRPLYDPSLQSPPPPDAPSAIVSAEYRGKTAGSVGWTQLVSRGGDGNSASGADLSSSSGFDVTDRGAYLASNVKDMADNTASSAGDLSCDSEKRPEVSGIPGNTVRSRNSSKRSRAAEVHNMSEKRRRSRINERMKALQKLIPNSNKTDKASMLDEAIEYLKQLQLQVQMLSMRNGLSAYPVCLPGVLYPTQICSTGTSQEGTGRWYPNPENHQFSAAGETSVQPAFAFSNQYLYSKEPITLPLATDAAITSDTQFRFEPSPHANYGSFNLTPSSEKEIHEDSKQLS